MRKINLKIITWLFTAITLPSFSQNIVIDAGHGWGPSNGNGTCTNPDTRLPIEMEASHSVAHKLKNLFNADCNNVNVYLTRPTNDCNSWISLPQRTAMANSWDADIFLSIHTNSFNGIAKGTETFYCANNPQRVQESKKYSDTIQKYVANDAQLINRRSVEDASYIFHLYVLSNTNSHAVLNEMGFGDNSSDYAKLSSNVWRDTFANAYYKSIKGYLDYDCNNPIYGSQQNPIILDCNKPYSGNTVLGSTNVNNYTCGPQSMSGKEKYHKLTVTDTSLVTVQLSNLDVDLDLLMLNNINQPGNCSRRDDNTIQTTLNPGTYYFVVDGFGNTTSNQGTYTITALNCNASPSVIREYNDTTFVIRNNTITRYDTVTIINGSSVVTFRDTFVNYRDTQYILFDTNATNSSNTKTYNQRVITPYDTTTTTVDTIITTTETIITRRVSNVTIVDTQFISYDTTITNYATTITQYDSINYYTDTVITITDSIMNSIDTTVTVINTLISTRIDSSASMLQDTTLYNTDTTFAIRNVLVNTTDTATVISDSNFTTIDTTVIIGDTIVLFVDTNQVTIAEPSVAHQLFPTIIDNNTEYIYTKLSIDKFNIRLYDLIGNFYPVEKTSYAIKLPILSKGLYILQLYNEKQGYYYKIVKID